MYNLDMPTELNGAFWVWIFLPISGYLIGKSFFPEAYGLKARGYAQFLWNRSLRIIPLYELALCIGLLMTLAGSAENAGIQKYFTQFLFCSPLNRTTLSGPLWTVAAEIHFYVLSFFLVGVLFKVRGNIFLQILILILSFAISGWYIDLSHDLVVQPRTVIGNLPFFLFGLILAIGEYDGFWRISKAMKVSSISFLVMVAWFLNNWHPEYFWSIGPRNLLGAGPFFRQYIPLGGGSLCALTITFLVLCTEVKDQGSDWLDLIHFQKASRFLAWCGFLTYGIYVWHSVLSKANQVFFHLEPGLGSLFLLLISLPMAYFSYRYIESPILRFKYSRSS